jgi:hypothetical protein
LLSKQLEDDVKHFLEGGDKTPKTKFLNVNNEVQKTIHFQPFPDLEALEALRKQVLETSFDLQQATTTASPATPATPNTPADTTGQPIN